MLFVVVLWCPSHPQTQTSASLSRAKYFNRLTMMMIDDVFAVFIVAFATSFVPAANAVAAASVPTNLCIYTSDCTPALHIATFDLSKPVVVNGGVVADLWDSTVRVVVTSSDNTTLATVLTFQVGNNKQVVVPNIAQGTCMFEPRVMPVSVVCGCGWREFFEFWVVVTCRMNQR